MASTYTDGLAVEIIGSGDKAGSWGDVTNNNLKALEEGISRYAEIGAAGSNTSTLNIPDGQTAYTDDSKGRSAVIKWTGAIASGDSHTVTLQVGGAEATQARFTAINGLSSSKDLVIDTASGTSLTIPNGYSADIHLDGSGNVVNSFSGLAVDKLALKNNEIISNETNDQIVIAADTVKVGDDGAATLSSNGDQDLILKTGNSTTGNITLVDGSNGDISITPEGSGKVVMDKVNIGGGEIDGTPIGANAASTGAFTSATVDDIVLDGKVITMTGSPSDTATFTAGTNGTLDIVTTDAAATAANINITADGKLSLTSASTDIDSIDITSTAGGVHVDIGEFNDAVYFKVPNTVGASSAFQFLVTRTGPYLHEDGGRYLNFSSGTGSGGFGLRGTNSYLEASNRPSDGWGQVYHSGMTSGQGAYIEIVSSSILANTDGGATAHLMGQTPRIVTVEARCKVAEYGYSVDDIVYVGYGSMSDSRGVTVSANATTIQFSIGSGGIEIIERDPSGTNGQQGLDNDTNWELKIRAWK